MQTFDWISKQAHIRPNKTALVDLDSGRRYSYKEFNERSSRFAEYLIKDFGVSKGDRVAILAENCTEYFEILYGCAKAEVILVCLNYRLSQDELVGILSDSSPRLLISDSGFSHVAEDLRNAIDFETLDLETIIAFGAAVVSSTSMLLDYEAILEASSGNQIDMPVSFSSECWHLLYTSGTTGVPKGVIQTPKMVVANAVNCILAANLSQKDACLSVLPCFHTGGLNLFANPIFYAGGTVIVCKRVEADTIIDCLQGEATVMFAVSRIYELLLNSEKFERADFSNIRGWFCGGGPLSQEVYDRYKDQDLLIQNGFGMTETGPALFISPAEYAKENPMAVGKLMIGSDVKILDDTGQEVERNNAGEVVVKGDNITPGYWGRDEETNKAIKAGWFYSGDIGLLDDNDLYYIVDRKKDMYISGGENVYPSEVENVILSIEGCIEAAVVGAESDKWGEVGVAFIVKDDLESVTEDYVIQYCREKLAHYKAPEKVIFLDELPRNAIGKIQKGPLREIAGDL